MTGLWNSSQEKWQIHPTAISGWGQMVAHVFQIDCLRRDNKLLLGTSHLHLVTDINRQIPN